MDTKVILGLIGITLTIIGYIPYISDTLKGKTTPHSVSWFILTVLSTIAFGIQYTNGAGASAFITLTATVITAIITILSFKYGSKRIVSIDYLFLALALISLILWRIVDQPEIATILQVAAGMLALGPTIRKSWIFPEEETLSTQVLNTIRHTITLLAVSNYSISTALHPFAWAIVNGGLSLLLIVRRKALRTSSKKIVSFNL